jgi:acyl carrier protein
MDECEQQLRDLIITELRLEDVEPSELTTETPLFEGGLGLSSLDALELVVVLETHYGVRIEDPEVGKVVLANIGAMARFIKEQQASREQDESQ